MGLSCFVLRKQTYLSIVAAVLTMLVQIGLVLLAPVDAPMRLLGLTVTLDPLSRLFLLAFYVVAGLSFVVSWSLPHGENFISVALLLLGFTGATLFLLQEPFVVSLLLVSAGISAVLAIVDLPTGSATLVGRAAIGTGLKYLVLIVVAGLMMYLAFVLISIYRPEATPDRVSPAHLILGLMAVGFGLRLAVVPFHSWLPDLVEDTAPMVSVIVIGVVNVTSLLVLINVFQFFPVLITENERGLAVLRWLGIATALLGAGLALSQPSMRRVLGSLMVYNAGMVLFGVTTVSTLGLAGALFEAFNQTLVALLLFLSLGLLERPDGRPPHHVRRDLLRRWPVAGAGLLGGGLALIGLPPFNGFASKLLIYEAAARSDGWQLALLLLASGLALLALLLLARDRLLGPSEDQLVEEVSPMLGATELDHPARRRMEPEPRGMAVLTSALLGSCLAVGLYPQPVLATINEVIRGLTFVKAL